jgi:hypothetical protein
MFGTTSRDERRNFFEASSQLADNAIAVSQTNGNFVSLLPGGVKTVVTFTTVFACDNGSKFKPPSPMNTVRNTSRLDPPTPND